MFIYLEIRNAGTHICRFDLFINLLLGCYPGLLNGEGVSVIQMTEEINVKVVTPT